MTKIILTSQRYEAKHLPRYDTVAKQMYGKTYKELTMKQAMEVNMKRLKPL